MAGPNTAYDQYAVGKGSLFIAPYSTVGGVQTLGAYRFFGNAPTITLTPNTTTLDHVSSVSGLNTKDRSITLTDDLTMAFTTDNMSAENKALWLGAGAVQTQTVVAQTAQTQTITSPVLGGVYPIGVTPTLPMGAKDVTVTGAMQGGTALTAGTDYSVNGRTGLFAVLTNGAAVADTPITITYSVAAATRSVINNQALTVLAAVRFESLNPDTGNGPVNEEHFLPFVTLRPTGDLALITDTWQTMGFTGEVLSKQDIVGNPIIRHTVTSLTN